MLRGFRLPPIVTPLSGGALDIGDLETHTAHVGSMVAEPNFLLAKIRNARVSAAMHLSHHFGHGARMVFTWDRIRWCCRCF